MVRNVMIRSFYRETNVKDTSGTSFLVQENQAIKRQKLDGGLSRQVTVCCYLIPKIVCWCSLSCDWYNFHKLSLFQILNVKPHTLPHKSKVGTSNLCSSVADKTNKEERKIYVREPAPFVSMAEMMRKFQSSTRDLSLPHVSVLIQSYFLPLSPPTSHLFDSNWSLLFTGCW